MILRTRRLCTLALPGRWRLLGREVRVALQEDLRRYVGAHLAAFKVPSQVFVFAEPLPRNASGKLLRRALRDQALASRTT